MSTSQAIEKYVEETIIEYLESQRDLPEFSYETLPEYVDARNGLVDDAEDKHKAFIIDELINDLLHDLDRTVDYQQHYKKTQEQHHQYALFDLANLIPGFEIDENRMKELCFKESLMISNVDQPMANGDEGVKPVAVGGMCLKIEQAQGLKSQPVRTEQEMEKNILQTIKQLKKDLAQKLNDNETDEEKISKYEAFLNESMTQSSLKFVVHVSTEFDVEGHDAGSRITSWVDKDLHTLEERRTEYISESKKSSNKQTIYFALQENKYFVKNQTQGADPNETRKYCPLSITKDLIGEGANLIFMRYLAIIKYKGNIELSTLHINGSMCRNIYECRGPKPGIVNNFPVELCKIYRTIIEKCGIIHMSVTVLTVHGMIVSHEWEGCPYIIHMNPEFVTVGKPVPYDYIALKKIWDTNMEFVSKFLDCKTEAEIKMKTYQKDHPEVQEMLADYLQSILLLKPENIMPFTIDYFMSYEPYNLPQLPYFDDDLDKESSNQFW